MTAQVKLHALCSALIRSEMRHLMCCVIKSIATELSSPLGICTANSCSLQCQERHLHDRTAHSLGCALHCAVPQCNACSAMVSLALTETFVPGGGACLGKLT